MVFKYLMGIKSVTTDKDFKEILTMTEEDIKFNRVSFKKVTPAEEFITIFERCRQAYYSI